MYTLGVAGGIVVLSLALIALLKNIKEFTFADFIASACMVFIILIAVSELL